MRPNRFWGVAAVLAGIVLDQAHKAWMLGPFGLAERGRVPVLPWLDLVLVWNRGVSYGLFTEEGDARRWLLAGVGLVGGIVFAAWMWRSDRLLAALSLGLIASGAFSNAIDRLLYGAVADVFLVHVGSFEWYVFNLADAWIVAGVIGMILASLTERRENATRA